MATQLKDRVATRPIDKHVGIEFEGVDLTNLDDQTLADMRQALADHGMVFVRDQELTPEQHIAFARRWGEIDINNYFPANGGYPEIAEVRKAENQQTNIGGGWHTDVRRVRIALAGHEGDAAHDARGAFGRPYLQQGRHLFENRSGRGPEGA